MKEGWALSLQTAEEDEGGIQVCSEDAPLWHAPRRRCEQKDGALLCPGVVLPSGGTGP